MQICWGDTHCYIWKDLKWCELPLPQCLGVLLHQEIQEQNTYSRLFPSPLRYVILLSPLQNEARRQPCPPFVADISEDEAGYCHVWFRGHCNLSVVSSLAPPKSSLHSTLGRWLNGASWLCRNEWKCIEKEAFPGKAGENGCAVW